MLAPREPPLTVLRADFEKLSKLAALSGETAVTRYLEHELDRADVVTETTKPVVRLGSRVRYHDLARPVPIEITLVLPHEADISASAKGSASRSPCRGARSARLRL